MSNIVYPNRLKGSSIRLLELLPGDLDDELECRLVETPLHDITTFEALSYVWGDPAIREPIKCNGQAMTITTNLAQALRRLRLSRAAPSKGQLEQADLPQQEADEHDQSTGISRVLWADAICINQEDIIERGQQVQLMREIYTKATGLSYGLGLTHRDMRRRHSPQSEPYAAALMRMKKWSRCRAMQAQRHHG